MDVVRLVRATNRDCAHRRNRKVGAVLRAYPAFCVRLNRCVARFLDGTLVSVDLGFSGDVVEFYHRYRHGYPAAVIDVLADAFQLALRTS